MSIFSVFTLLGGLAFFIFGMNQMSDSLEKIAGKRMEEIINKMTQNRLLGLLMGCIITIAIQSSSAVTVMLVGLVNSGLMNIGNTVGVIMGSNIGTTVTAWIMSLIGVSSDNVLVRMLKPESFSPLLAFIGIILIMLAKKTNKKELGNGLLGEFFVDHQRASQNHAAHTRIVQTLHGSHITNAATVFNLERR